MRLILIVAPKLPRIIHRHWRISQSVSRSDLLSRLAVVFRLVGVRSSLGQSMSQSGCVAPAFCEQIEKA